MVHFKNRHNGFTLIEMVVSLGIFMLFIGLILNIFINLTATQQKTNSNRETVSEAKNILNLITTEAKEKSLDYNCYDKDAATCGTIQDTLALISPNGLNRVIIKKECTENQCNLFQINQNKQNDLSPTWFVGEKTQLNSEKLRIKDIQFFITPIKNPFDINNAAEASSQFQPIFHVILNLYRNNKSDPDNSPIIIQSSISSRIYNNL